MKKETIKYFKRFFDENEPYEISKDEARNYLSACYNPDFIDEIIDGSKIFRLNTMFSQIWTETADGKTPAAGFYGLCE